jgi:CRISPR-associated endonuclease/helicase Cas3
MTATQPLIFEPGEIWELLPDKERYFKRLDRVELQLKLEPVELRDFIEEVISDIEENPGKSFLIVLNTIQSSQIVYEAIMDKGLPNISFFYLSTMVAPVERLARIRAATVEKGRRVIVSTQLVEAGVDLDVDVVYRDFATLDSINQVAGRCNRNAASGRGTVKLRNLRDERGRLIHEYIYGKDLVPLIKTQEVLEGRNSILEAEFLETVERYYCLLQGSLSTDDAKKILRHLNDLDFKKLREEFSLIEDDQPKVDIFVELDDEAEMVWRNYLEVKALNDRAERKLRFTALKRRFYDYVISIPERYASEEGVNGGDEVGYIPRALVDRGNTYRRDIGFNRLKNAGEDTLIL